MNKNMEPSAPPSDTAGLGAMSSAPPSYDEAVRNVQSGLTGRIIVNPAHTTTSTVDEGDESKKDDDKKKQAPPPLNAAPPPVVTAQPQSATTYNFVQPVNQPVSSTNDCLLCCWIDDGHCLSDLCYCIFCCSRHVTGHDAGCCHCGDDCCSCPDGCCECGDCDCDCGDCDCDCGSCDCGGADCNCGDCVIL